MCSASCPMAGEPSGRAHTEVGTPTSPYEASGSLIAKGGTPTRPTMIMEVDVPKSMPCPRQLAPDRPGAFLQLLGEHPGPARRVGLGLLSLGLRGRQLTVDVLERLLP